MKKKSHLNTIAMNMLNGFMRLLLRSPLHRLASKSVLLITLTGRKSGRTITTPVSYIREGQIVTVFTRAAWRRNLDGGALVRLWIAGREYSGWAVPCDNEIEAVQHGLMRFLTLVPGDARFYGVAIDPQGIPNAEQVHAAARGLTMIQVKLSSRGMR